MHAFHLKLPVRAFCPRDELKKASELLRKVSKAVNSHENPHHITGFNDRPYLLPVYSQTSRCTKPEQWIPHLVG
jgi:hypothetical protein